MSIKKAGTEDFQIVKKITVETINAIYPHYYPKGAVEFFLGHHNDENILRDIENDKVFLCTDEEGNAVGTVTLNENEIGRLFVLPEFQGRGYGRELLEFSESAVSEKYDSIVLHASLPAKNIYLRRGFRITESHVINAPHGDYLCYDLMVKESR